MPKATLSGGPLVPLTKCFLKIPGLKLTNHTPQDRITFDILPDITDSKSATYNDATVMGRATPIKTYSHSDNRVISMQFHFIVTEHCDIVDNLEYLRGIQSAVYPRTKDIPTDSPYLPPVVCEIKCGEILGAKPLCVVLTTYSVKFQTDTAWDERTFLPYVIDVDTTWHVVYTTTDLPGQDRILTMGR